MNSRYYLTFKSTFQSEKPKKLEKSSFNVKFWIGIICILLHWWKKVTLIDSHFVLTVMIYAKKWKEDQKKWPFRHIKTVICTFFWRLRNNCCWVWQITRTTVQYFLIWLRSFSISFLPRSSFHFRQALVKAFFLDLDLYFFRVGKK